MERFVIIVNGWKPLTIITKHSILDVAAVLDPPLNVLMLRLLSDSFQKKKDPAIIVFAGLKLKLSIPLSHS